MMIGSVEKINWKFFSSRICLVYLPEQMLKKSFLIEGTARDTRTYTQKASKVFFFSLLLCNTYEYNYY